MERRAEFFGTDFFCRPGPDDDIVRSCPGNAHIERDGYCFSCAICSSSPTASGIVINRSFWISRYTMVCSRRARFWAITSKGVVGNQFFCGKGREQDFPKR